MAKRDVEEIKKEVSDRFSGKSKSKNRNARRSVSKQKSSNKYDPTAKEAGGNDLSWHWKDQLLGTAASSIPWSWSTGRRMRLNGVEGVSQYLDKYIPGILTLRTALTPGVGTDRTTAINIAAQALYTDIRRMLKSANAYESSDVVMYIMAVGEIMAYISWCTRLYATTMLYSYQNRYLPDALIRAQGVDPNDLHNNAIDFLSRINQAIAKASQIYIPKGFDFLERCRWEYANYYSEGDSIKDQIYMFTPGVFRHYRYDESQDYAGALVPFVKIEDTTFMSYVTIVSYLNNMIDAVVGDSDFTNIAGDLMNRYGESGVMSFSLIPQDAVISIVSGPAAFEVLEQIQNAKPSYSVQRAYSELAVGDESTHRIFKVGQDETQNCIVIQNDMIWNNLTDPAKNLMKALDGHDTLLNVHDNPSPEKTMLISRFINMASAIEEEGTQFSTSVEAAADFVLQCTLWSFNPNTTGTTAVSNPYNMCGTTANFGLIASIAAPFHYLPNWWVTDGNNNLVDVIGNFDITAILTAEQLRDMNRVDMMSMLAVPDIGKLTK